MEVLPIALCSACREPLNAKGECLVCLLRGGLPVSEEHADAPGYGDFEIESRADGSLWELGAGAMGVTYRARDRVLNRAVALKVIQIPPTTDDGEAVRARFLREARATAALKHASVASIYQFGVAPESDRCFYAMELVEGETLEALVRREGPLAPEKALDLAIQVTRALVAAAGQGLVHRDLKPGNVMIVDHDEKSELEVKVIDFGLAKALNAVAEADLTHGSFVGTPAFASPEQFAGAPADARSDIYSLGATLWYALTGEAPYRGKTISEIRAEQESTSLPFKKLSERRIPRPLIAILRRTLAVEPVERPASAKDLLGQLERCRTTSYRRRLGILVSAGIIAAAVVGTLLFWRGAPPAAPNDKSIAVLPFENLGDDKEDAAFAGGVQDEILSNLAKVADLKVISRTSVMQYAGGASRNVRQIARDLGVTHLLEGTVQRAGDRVRVRAQLIDARIDRHLWAEEYDRDVADVFALQSEIAQQIADQLTSKLSPAERAAIAEPPTTNLNAYELYVGARNIAPWENGQGAQKSLAQKATLLQQATEHDPAFALAWCALAKTECDLSEFGEPDAHLPLAKKAADNALRLRPNLGEAHRELGRYYRRHGELELARAEVALARRTLPNDSEVRRIAGEIDYRQSHWDAAVGNLEKALDLDPRNDEVRFRLGHFYRATRRYRAWARLLAKDATGNGSQSYWFLLESAEFKLDTGDAAGAQSLLAQIPLDFSPTFLIWPTRFAAALYSRDYEGASRVIEATPAEFAPGLNRGLRPNSCADGAVAHFRGDEQKAQAIFAVARKNSDTPWGRALSEDETLTYLAYCDAGLGRKSEAVSEVEKAVHLGTTARDPFQSEDRVETLAPIYAWVGDKTRAIEQLELLSKLPSGTCYGDLLLDPTWDGLRGDPRFEKLVGALKPENLPAPNTSTR